MPPYGLFVTSVNAMGCVRAFSNTKRIPFSMLRSDSHFQILIVGRSTSADQQLSTPTLAASATMRAHFHADSS
jgi:hypothetical protein